MDWCHYTVTTGNISCAPVAAWPYFSHSPIHPSVVSKLPLSLHKPPILLSLFSHSLHNLTFLLGKKKKPQDHHVRISISPFAIYNFIFIFSHLTFLSHLERCPSLLLTASLSTFPLNLILSSRTLFSFILKLCFQAFAGTFKIICRIC